MFLPINQYITVVSVYFCLKMLFFNTCFWLSFELLANSTITHARINLTQHKCFIHKSRHRLLGLRNISLYLRAILNNKMDKKLNNANKMVMNRLQKVSCLLYESWNRIFPYLNSFGNVYVVWLRFFATFRHSVCICEYPWKQCKYLFGDHKCILVSRQIRKYRICEQWGSLVLWNKCLLSAIMSTLTIIFRGYLNI